VREIDPIKKQAEDCFGILAKSKRKLDLTNSNAEEMKTPHVFNNN
jgi:hypothetical protein